MNVLANGLRLMGGKVIQEPLKAGACIAYAFFVNWQLTLLTLFMGPLSRWPSCGSVRACGGPATA